MVGTCRTHDPPSDPVAEILSVDASTPTAAPSNAGANRLRNPSFIRSGHLNAPGFSEHRIYWEEYGTMAGEPVMVLHGGPGAGSHSSLARFFNPQRYRVILFDQRGCGKSAPSAGDDDPTAALTENTTQHLVDDMSALRHELNRTRGPHLQDLRRRCRRHEARHRQDGDDPRACRDLLRADRSNGRGPLRFAY